MHLRPIIIALSLIIGFPAAAGNPPPEAAIRYHTALLKTPENPTLFDRFFNAWLDEQPVEALQTFLTHNAADGAGPHLAILARFQLRRSLEDEALATLARAITARPDDPSLLMDRATVLLRRLDFQNARADLEIAAASPHPTLAIEAAKLIGRSHLRQGNTAEAIKAWDALLAKHPHDLDLLEDLVESAAAEGRYPEAIQYIDQLIARSKDPYRTTLAQLRRAELLARSGMSDEAAHACTTALANVGANSWLESEILAQFEKIHRSQDRISDLITALRTLADANPHRTLIHRNLAKLEAEDGQADAAIVRFREILRRSPGDDTLLDEFINLLTAADQHPQAIAELQKKITTTPTDAELHLRIAALHAKLDDRPATLASLKAAKALLISAAKDEATDAEPASLRIATLMLSYGLDPEAEVLLTTLAAAPNATAAPAETLANHFALTQRRDLAIALLESAATARDPETLIRISNTIARLGEPARAHILLASRYEDLKDAPHFLTSIVLAALASEAPTDAIPPATRLLRLATQETDIRDAVELATRAIRAAKQSAPWRENLAAIPSPTAAEILLHASLAEHDRDFPAVATLLNSQDPTIIRFHVALLQRRGDFPAALATIQPLIQSPEASNPSFLKSLADLQLQNNQTDAALATLAQWKLAAPGDKTPWTITIRHLESLTRLPEAITTTRRALAQFTDDPDFSAILASLFESTGAFADAEAIHWRLYDAATDPTEQSRIATRLATLAIRTSTTAALQEKLERRALTNRRSIAPVLAQIELARTIGDQPALRDLLQQAHRIQPENPDYRLQLADLEEKSHNPQLAIEWLKGGLDRDPSHTLQLALAQLHIRLGDVLEGVRILRSLDLTKSNTDPTRIASLTQTILNAGMPEEAATFLSENLTHDPSHHALRHLLATILADDGREDEALPVFISLLHDTQPAQSSFTMQDLHLALGARHQRHHQGHRSNTPLPADVSQSRILSLIRLVLLGQSGPPEIQARIAKIEDPDFPFIQDLIDANFQASDPAEYLALLRKHPSRSILWEIAVGRHGHQSLDPSSPEFAWFVDWAANHRENPELRFRVAAMLLRSETNDPALADLFLESATLAAESSDPQALVETTSHIFQRLTLHTSEAPIPHHAELAALIMQIVDSGNLQPPYQEAYRLRALAILGRTSDWIEAFNRSVSNHRANPQTSAALFQAGSHFQWRHHGIHTPAPTIQTIQLPSLPMQSLRQILPKDQTASGYATIHAPDLLPHLHEFDSPLLRAYIAIVADDLPTARKILASPPDAHEAGDFQLLNMIIAITENDMQAAWNAIAPPPDSTSPPNIQVINILSAILQKMSDDQRLHATPQFQTILTSAHNHAAPGLKPHFENIINQHGLQATAAPGAPNAPPVPSAASFAQRRIPQSSHPHSRQRPPTPIDRAAKLSAVENHDDAARELLQHLRQNGVASIHPRINDLNNLTIHPATRTAILTLTAPGESNSLNRRLTHINTCLLFAETDTAIAELKKLTADRPHDAGLHLKLAFLLPPDQATEAHALLDQAAAAPDFAEFAHLHATSLSRGSNPEPHLAFWQLITSWLEATPPQQIQSANLSWITNHAWHAFSGRNQLPNLLAPPPDPPRDPDPLITFIPIAKRLTTAMMQHPALAEEGFRLNLASKHWQTPPPELDQAARNTLLLASTHATNDKRHDHFQYIDNNRGHHQPQDNLSTHASLRWLTDRLATLPAAQVFPPSFLAELRSRNPDIAESISNLVSLNDASSLDQAWKSPAFTATDPTSRMIAEAIAAKSITLPGSLPFFLKGLDTPTGHNTAPRNVNLNAQTQHPQFGSTLLKTALLVATQHGDDATEKACASIVGNYIPLPPDWESPEFPAKLNLLQNRLYQIIRNLGLPPTSLISIARALTRLDIPLRSHDLDHINSSFNQKLTTANEAIEIHKSLGLLEDTPAWKPITILTNTDGANPPTRKHIHITQLSLNFSPGKEAFHDALAAIDPPTFGTLITEAAYQSESGRRILTARAFTHAMPHLWKMPDDRLRDFAPFLPWLSAEIIASLPPSLQKQAIAFDHEKLAALIQNLDRLEQRSGQPTLHNSGFGNLIGQIIPLDFDLAHQRYLRAIDAYTAAHNQTTLHDQILANIISQVCRDDRTIPHALRFLHAIADSPTATRHAFTSSQDPSRLPILYDCGIILARTPLDPPTIKSNWLTMAAKARTLPEDLQNDAFAAAAITMITGNFTDSNLSSPEVVERSSGPPERFRALVEATRTFKSADPDQRTLLATHITTVLGDPTIREFTRTQLALAIASSTPAVLEHPTLAAIIADFISPYANADRSAVSNPVLRAVENIANLTHTAENLPHLTRIHQAFWTNANSPKTLGHPDINTNQAKNLLFTALALGDEATATHIFTAIQPDLVGDSRFIHHLITTGHFDLASRILPDESQEFLPVGIPGQYTPELDAAIVKFRPVATNPLALLRFEARLLSLRTSSQFDSELDIHTARIDHLTTAYRSHPPTNSTIQAELLAAITTSTHPAFTPLAPELSAFAATLTPTAVINDWSSSNRDSLHALQWSILCKSASIEFIIGNPAPFVALIEAVAKFLSSGASASSSHTTYTQILNYLGPATYHAIAHNNTDSFAVLVEPLGALATSMAASRNPNQHYITQVLALTELFAYTSGTPQTFTPLLQPDTPFGETVRKAFANPRQEVPFARIMMEAARAYDSLKFEAAPMAEVVTALLSNPSLTDILPADRPLLHSISGYGHYKTIQSIAENPPESLTPAGRALCALHVLKRSGSRDQLTEKLRAAVADIPPGDAWKTIRITARIDLAIKLAETPEGKAEAITLLKSIPPDDVPTKLKTNYETLLQKLSTPK